MGLSLLVYIYPMSIKNTIPPYLLHTILIGVLVFLYINLTSISSALLYPNEDDYSLFLRFVGMLGLIAFGLGMALKPGSLNDKSWKSWTYVFLFLNLVILVYCTIKDLDEINDEFYIYICLTCSAMVFFLFGLGGFIRLLIKNNKLATVLGLIAIGILSGAIIYYLLSILPFIFLYHMWILANILMVLLTLLSSSKRTPF